MEEERDGKREKGKRNVEATRAPRFTNIATTGLIAGAERWKEDAKEKQQHNGKRMRKKMARGMNEGYLNILYPFLRHQGQPTYSPQRCMRSLV